MDVFKIINKYYQVDSKVYYYLVEHSKSVAKFAVEIANKVNYLNPDIKFIEEAAMLHDIGIFMTNASGIGCFGDKLYVEHGYLGRKLMEEEGFPKHALVCERHVGAGITIADIERQNLPFPKREMVPVTLEEEIICFADKYFSKNEKHLTTPKSTEKVLKSLSRFGDDKVAIFKTWLQKFGYND